MSIPSLQSLVIAKIPVDVIWENQLHLDTELPISLRNTFRARFTFQTLLDEDLFTDDLDPELIYACLKPEQHHCLWYFLGYTKESPSHPFEDPSITSEDRTDALFKLRSFLLFFVQHPGQLLVASTGYWYGKSRRCAWGRDEIGFYLYLPLQYGQDLDARPYKTIDHIIAILIENLANLNNWEVIPIEIIPDKEKRALQALHSTTDLDYNIFRRDLHRHLVEVNGRLQFSIHPLTNAEQLTFRMIGNYLYVATENTIFYYHQDDGDLLLSILDYNREILSQPTATL